MTTTPDTAVHHELPVVDWIDPAELSTDPYPSYERLRQEAPVAWIPAINKVVFSTYEGCLYVENHPEIFSSHVQGAAMVRALGGRPLIRKDDPEHAAERTPMNRALRPKNIMEAWTSMFQANADYYMDRLEEAGPGAELNTTFAAPLAAKNLIDMLGMKGVDPLDMARWSLDFIAGSGNVLDVQDIWDRCDRSRTECDAALDETIGRLRLQPDASITSAMLEGGMPEDVVRNNAKLAISGGVNEPQHMVTNLVHELSQKPELIQAAQEDEKLWDRIFNEGVRKDTPIGMITRETIVDGEFNGFHIPAGMQVGAILGSANRDAAQFSSPDEFNIHREETTNLSFGRGVHQCAGKWAAQTSIGRIAVPSLYRRFPNLRQDPDRTETWHGWVFRGITDQPVIW